MANSKFKQPRTIILLAFVTLAAASTAKVLSEENLASLLAGGKVAQGAIDSRSMSKPGRNTVFSCNRAAMGQALPRPWVDASGVIDLAKKPKIDGAVRWESTLIITEAERLAEIAGNGLPNHPTGKFPVERDSEAYRYDRNPNSIRSYSLRFDIPLQPQLAEQPGCLPMGIVGVALSGGVFFNALDAPGRDAVANEVFDKCEGHPERNGRYHYHHDSPCFDQGRAGSHSPLVGYALDGFGIYGPRDIGGAYISNAELDACHGHNGAVPGPGNMQTITYHYHVNREFPYTLGCFRGVVNLPAARPLPRG